MNDSPTLHHCRAKRVVRDFPLLRVVSTDRQRKFSFSLFGARGTMDWSDESIVNTLASLAARAREEQVRSNGDPELFGTPPPPITEIVGNKDTICPDDAVFFRQLFMYLEF